MYSLLSKTENDNTSVNLKQFPCQYNLINKNNILSYVIKIEGLSYAPIYALQICDAPIE
ncbi:protein of unknown function [Candidatus Nitrotoga arctica]|uniref:Uncharacterized protein n=1 Tax=Candidatus Nitrotoga arctica TaxID=453162 RepID=A0ABN8AMN8_9PROT|nr:protein of unknown function [Candidatus Nitrotoga arctica]